MATLNLLFQKIKEPFVVKELNLLFVFQVNCPGCFLYGIPMSNELFKKYNDNNFGILGLSTAFEDFEFNNLENTLLLLEKNLLVGVTQKHLGAKYHDTILFPVAMDQQISKDEATTKENIDKICQLNSKYELLTQQEKQFFRERINNYFDRFPSLSYTFSMNQLPGTPTFILFDKKMEIISGWFGHQNIKEIESVIKKHKI